MPKSSITNIQSFPTNVESLLLFIPAALSAYFFERVLHLPLGTWVVVITGVYFAQVRFQSKSGGSIQAPSDSGMTFQKGDIWTAVIAAFILLIVLAPALRYGWLLGGGDYPSAFLSADESYNFMISQALVQGFPPADLGYLGRVSAYHLGGPLLAEMLHRHGLATLHLAFYAICPVALKISAAAAIYFIIGQLAPGLNSRKRMLGVLFTSGFFTIDFYNVLWNFRNAVKAGYISTGTIFNGMPVITAYPGFIGQELHYAAPLAITFFLALVANLHRSNNLLLACGLFSIFLAKSSVFVPIGVAWGIFSIYWIISHRESKFVVAGAIALVLCLLARPFAMETGIATLGLGHGYGFDWLYGQGENLVKASGVTVPPIAVLAGAGLVALGTHLFGWAGLSSMESRSKPLRGEATFIFLSLSMLLAGLFSTFVVFKINPDAQAGFDAIHYGIRERLWRPFDSYIYELGKMSIGEARIVISYSFAIICMSALLDKVQYNKYYPFKAAGYLVLLMSAAFCIWQSYHASLGMLPASMKTISNSTSQALAAIPVPHSVILTNECAYDREVELHMPLMNAAMSAVYGHQFWTCNFMFGNNFAVKDAPERLSRLKWFWGTVADDAHLEFLKNNGITHLLVDRRSNTDGNVLLSLDIMVWLEQIHINNEYSVYRLK